MGLTILEIAGVGIGALVVMNLVKTKKTLKDSGDKKMTSPPNTSQDDTNFNNGQPGVMMAESSLINQRNYEQNITQEKGKPYPIAFDPANDFLPRYRWPDGSVWSPAYNPVDSYRPLDYQLTTSLSEVVY
jgi:hypothetical protein